MVRAMADALRRRMGLGRRMICAKLRMFSGYAEVSIECLTLESSRQGGRKSASSDGSEGTSVPMHVLHGTAWSHLTLRWRHG